MPMCYIHLVTVEGRSAFPIDMLRYDDCIPADERSSGIISVSINPYVQREGETYRVEVRHSGLYHWQPTVGRWESFGWHVINCERREYY